MRQSAATMWLAIFLVTTATALAAQVKDLPDGWFRAGNRPADYDMGVDASAGRTGGAAFIRARTTTPGPGFATIMQDFSGTDYLGKRLRLSGYIKAANVGDWAGLWLRVDGPSNAPLAFDNMQNRSIKGTQAWRRYEIVLDVPAGATNIAFGMLLSGAGQVWMDDLQFDVVGSDVATTGSRIGQPPATSPKPPTPRNLAFD